MKKTYFLLVLAISLLAIEQPTSAQIDKPTIKTATEKMGYTILNPNETIKIYKYQHRAHPPKAAEQYAPKYYFVTGSSDQLQLLTKDNLKKAFPDNHPFHDAVEVNFKEDKELPYYDDFHMMYKINHLLEMSTKK